MGLKSEELASSQTADLTASQSLPLDSSASANRFSPQPPTDPRPDRRSKTYTAEQLQEAKEKEDKEVKKERKEEKRKDEAKKSERSRSEERDLRLGEKKDSGRYGSDGFDD